jgi:hypothetical protein
MQYEDVIRDFAIRTRLNLELVEASARNGKGEAYEVTQLVNSMLGLLVFPKEQYFHQIPKTPLKRLAQDGWPVPRSSGELPDASNLRELVRYMRNAVAHFNVEFQADQKQQITGLRLWNSRNGRYGPKSWEAVLSVADLREITMRFIDLIEKSHGQVSN